MTSITDDDGDEVAIYEYDAFGNVLTEAGSLSNEFKFSTKQADSRGQLIDFGFRWYDPEVGRWTQRDPLGVAGGLNLYSYCNSNPPNLVDPWGLQWWQQEGGRRDEENCGRRGKPTFQTPVPGGWSVSYEDLSQEFFTGEDPPFDRFDVPIVTPPEPEPEPIFAITPEDLKQAFEVVADWVEETLIPATMKSTSAVLEEGGKAAAGTAIAALAGALEPDMGRWTAMATGAKIGLTVGNYIPIPGAGFVVATGAAVAAAIGYDALFK